MLAVGLLSRPNPASAAGNSLRIEPGVQGVARDGTFDVKVVQNAEVASSGAQATVTFDPTLLQITAVAKGVGYAAAPVFTGAGPEAITAANGSGRLATVAAAFLPPGNVPAGDQDFLVISFRAIACGQAELGLPVGPADASILDGQAGTYGQALPITTSGGRVVICNSLRIDPPERAVARDATFDIKIVQNAEAPTSGAQATVTFDPRVLQITKVARGAAYAAAPVFTGATQAAVTAANTSGRLATVAEAFLPPGSAPKGDQEVLVVTFKAIACGQALLGLPVGPADGSLLDGRTGTYGAPLAISATGARVAICNSMRVEPANLAVARDATFDLKVVQNAEVATSGAQATVTFDKTLVQVTKVAKGADYAAAPVFTGATEAAVTAANQSGSLVTVAAAFLPPGSAPAGDREFLVVTFKAIGCGQLHIGLPVGPADAALLDGRSATYGTPLTVAGVGGTVVTCSDHPTPTPTPTPSPTPAPTARPTATPRPTGAVAGVTSPPSGTFPAGQVPTTDPFASPSQDAIPIAEPSPTPSSIPAVLTSASSPNDPWAHNGWLSFALLAGATAGIALVLLIVALIVTGVVAAIVGAVVLARRGPGGLSL
jgi:hypothetical protein